MIPSYKVSGITHNILPSLDIMKFKLIAIVAILHDCLAYKISIKGYSNPKFRFFVIRIGLYNTSVSKNTFANGTPNTFKSHAMSHWNRFSLILVIDWSMYLENNVNSC